MTMKRLTNDYALIPCKECSGEGYVEHGPICMQPASMCCGGCYQQDTCYVCDGDGEVSTDFTDEEISRAARIYNNLMELNTHPEWAQKIEDTLYRIIELEKMKDL